MKIINRRYIEEEDIRQACAENKWFTHGTSEEYEKLFKMSEGIISDNKLYKICRYIADHSRDCYDIGTFMFVLNKYCLTTFVVEE